MQHNMLHPLDPFLRPVMEAAVQLGVLTAELLSERCNNQSLHHVADQVKHLQGLRYAEVHSYDLLLYRCTACMLLLWLAACCCNFSTQNKPLLEE